MNKIIEYENIQFHPLNVSDIPLIHKWFNTPHVQQFYSLRNWSLQEVFDKLSPYLSGEKPVWIFIAVHNNIPIGYVQYYRVIDFPWPEQDLPDSVIQSGAGMDLFIGEISYLGKGYGTQIVTQFLDRIIWPHFNYCVVDPDCKNQPAMNFYQKLSFKQHKIIPTNNALNQPVMLALMVLSKNIIG